jgi:ubiquinone/menaquinone biosynthesis C-methylase UbiE
VGEGRRHKNSFNCGQLVRAFKVRLRETVTVTLTFINSGNNAQRMSCDRDCDCEIRDYYQRRAPVYDRVYAYPERQEDLAYFQRTIPPLFDDRDVLEVAAGTGYWTQFIARAAVSIHAIDVSTEPLEVLKARNLPSNVRSSTHDAYDLQTIGQSYDAAFAGLWFSHVPVERRVEWLRQLNAVLGGGAQVVLLDNTVAQCERLPIVAEDDFGNSYQERHTDDGQTHRVIKNFPTSEVLCELTQQNSHQTFVERDHFWMFAYVVEELGR